MMEKEELLKEIARYCEENKLIGSFNGVVGNILVSFEVRNKLIACKECGRKL